MSAPKQAAIAFAAALAAACGKGASYSQTGPVNGLPGENAPLDDGGTADAGPDGGAGGTTPPVPLPAALVGSCSGATLITTLGTTCNGTLAGVSDAFSGTCNVTGPNAGVFSCTARSLLPGQIQCALGSSNVTCTIQVCIAGRDGGCSP